MPSIYTPNKVLELQATGENQDTWGVKLNTVISSIDSSFGVQYISLTGLTTYSLTTAQARAGTLVFTGAVGASVEVIVPPTPANYNVLNATTGTGSTDYIQMRTATGWGPVVPRGAYSSMFCDGASLAPTDGDHPHAFGLGINFAPQLTNHVNDFDFAGQSASSIIWLSTNATTTIWGLTGLAQPRRGRVVCLMNASGVPIDLYDEHVGSVPSNRFYLGAAWYGINRIQLGPQEGIILFSWDRWRAIGRHITIIDGGAV